MFYDIGFGNNFLDMTPKAQETTIKIDKLGYIKILNFCASKDTTNGVKRQCTEWEKVFESDLC